MRSVPVLTAADVRHWDSVATAGGRTLATLMSNAGRAVAQLIVERWGSAAKHGVMIACGPGNNGGDGWVTAQVLHALDIPVWVTESKAPTVGVASAARTLALHDGVRVVTPDGPWPGCALIVDALLGTGAEGAPRDEIKSLLARLSDLDLPIIAIDGPTGLDLDTGLHYGELRANTTITFGGARRGHLLSRDEVGELIVVDIGLGKCADSTSQLINAQWAADRLAPFAANAHKGTRGKVVIVGGIAEMAGAARIASRSAFAAGAGLVHLITDLEGAAVLRVAEPDVQVHATDLARSLDGGKIKLFQGADAVLIGPGLGRDPSRLELVLQVMSQSRRLVIDADALYALRNARSELRALAGKHTIVLTPHPGEFRTLFPEWGGDLDQAPWEAADAAARDSGATILLKGVPTVISDGGEHRYTIAAGNPGLATGGSGDLLSGILAAFLASGISPADAAAVAAQSLGDAADHAARRAHVRSMRPMDVVAALPDTWRDWERARGEARPRFPILWESPAPSTG